MKPHKASSLCSSETNAQSRRKTKPIFILLLGVIFFMSACSSDQGPEPIEADDLGPNTTVFDPSMPVSEIQGVLDATHAQQVDNEMGGARFAYLFKPGTYGTDEEPLQIKVGYYTEISGLGASPGDVVHQRQNRGLQPLLGG